MQDENLPTYPGYPQTYSQPLVASAPPPMPSLQEVPAMPPGPPASSGWRLGALVIIVVGLVITLAGTQAAALAATRKAAYPPPAVTVALGSSAPFRAGTAVQFTVSAAAGRQLSYSWDFGDEQQGAGPSVSHTYSSYGTYVVSVTATDPIGQDATAQQQITVLPLPPVACFNALQAPQDPLYVAFDASCSTGTQLSYSWNFGDGSSSTDGPQTEHQFGLGTFTVTLTVTDVAGQTASQSNSVTVNIPAPHAAFTYLQTSNDGYLACYNFDASASTGYQLSYNWSFGDGYSGYGQTTSDCYNTGNSYTITLSVTDGLGRSDSTSAQITV